MHNQELVEGVNISNFLLYLAAKPILEKSGSMLIYSNKDSNHLLLESNKNLLTEIIINSITKTITTVIIIIASIVLAIIIITVICCVCYFHKPEIQSKFKQMKLRINKQKSSMRKNNKKDDSADILQELLELRSPITGTTPVAQQKPTDPLIQGDISHVETISVVL